ncbi:hypothetical protein ACFVHW_03925 [Streptomyces sp. NPDC127110]|uniref:hypothetical protein n=1 Tax=Streptomyces sp. NPDC127110 TaxID=3345362 RepID=UPI00363E9446
MRFLHAVEVTDAPQYQAIWGTAIMATEAEEYDGSARAYAREVLTNWISDEQADYDDPVVTEDGWPRLRVRVWFADFPDDRVVAEVGADELDPAPPEIEALDIARDAKLYSIFLESKTTDDLAKAMSTARTAGHGANELARRVEDVVSRPVALRWMR